MLTPIGHVKEYLSLGISAIPCRKTQNKDGSISGKVSAVKEWSKYCKELPESDEVERWERLGNLAGLAIVLGEASNLCCIDVDYTDKEIQEKADKLIPYTPCKIKGARGYKYLYSLTEFPQSFTPPPKWKEKIGPGGKIDILWGNSYICIPPGIHSITDNVPIYYEWMGIPLSTVGINQLPVLGRAQVEALHLGLSGVSLENVPDGTIESDEDRGRWQHITSKAGKLISEKTPVTDAVSTLIKFDRDNYPLNQYFLDSSKGCVAKSDVVNAYKFYGDMLVMANRDKAEEVPPLDVKRANTEGGWGEIVEAETMEFPVFDTTLIPQVFYDPVMKNAEANGIEPQMLFFYFLTTISAVCGNRRLCQPYQNNKLYVEASGLYTLLVAKSGDRKTQMSKIARAPLMALNEELQQKSIKKRHEVETLNTKYKSQLVQMEHELKETDSIELIDQINELRGKIKDPPEYTVYEQRATAEKLYQLAHHNSSGLFIEINEWGASYEDLLTREKQNYRRFIMDGWDGTGAFKYTTKSSGSSYIKRLCLSIGASVQEDVLQNILGRIYKIQRENDGLMQRFLLICGSEKEKETYDSTISESMGLKNLYRSLYFQDVLDGPLIFSRDATSEWMAFQKKIAKEQRSIKDSVYESYLSKQVGLVVRIASLLTQIEGQTIVDSSTYKRAEQIIEWAKRSASLCYNRGQRIEEATIIEMFKSRMIEDDTTVRDLYRNHSRYFGTYDSTMAVLEQLHRRQVCRVYRDGKGMRVRINPNL